MFDFNPYFSPISFSPAPDEIPMRVIIISFTSVVNEYATSQLFYRFYHKNYSIDKDSGVYNYNDIHKIKPVSHPNKTILIFTGHHDNPKECISLPMFHGDIGEDLQGYNPEDVFTKIGEQLQNWPDQILFHNCYSGGLHENMSIGLCYRLLKLINNPNVLTYCYFDKVPRYSDTNREDTFMNSTTNVYVFRLLNDKVNKLFIPEQKLSHILVKLHETTKYDERSFTIVPEPVQVAQPAPIQLKPLSNSRLLKKRSGK